MEKIKQHKEPKYISWKLFLANTAGMIFLVLASSAALVLSLPNAESNGMVLSYVFAPAFTVLLPVETILLLIISVLREPRGYMRASVVDIMLVLPAIATVCLTGFLFSLDYILFIKNLWYLFVPIIIFTSLAVFINHKFGKSGTELGFSEA